MRENPEDAEAYWGLVLCRYGIEYVDDADGSKKPTCHRTVLTSILADADYQAAYEYAPPSGKLLYEEEAKRIDEIQKKIRTLAESEAPYDVFLCYRESEDGKRTRDSLDVQELYNRLCEKGFQVFYARKTLKDRLGEEYEPVIYAAIKSARVMVVYGSKPAYFQSVWVKNEWSRFLGMMKERPEKRMIPVFDGSQMTAYELPDALADFQAYDKYKVGFLEDLLDGLERILAEDLVQRTIQGASRLGTVQAVGINVENMLKRAFYALEEEDFAGADQFLENVLNENVEEPRAYIGKLLVKRKRTSEQELVFGREDFGADPMYQKALRFSKGSSYYEHVIALHKSFQENRLQEFLKEEENACRNKDLQKLEQCYYRLMKFGEQVADFDAMPIKRQAEELYENSLRASREQILLEAQKELAAGNFTKASNCLLKFPRALEEFVFLQKLLCCSLSVPDLEALAEAQTITDQAITQDCFYENLCRTAPPEVQERLLAIVEMKKNARLQREREEAEARIAFAKQRKIMIAFLLVFFCLMVILLVCSIYQDIYQ